MTTLHMGAASADITPAKPVPLAGFAARTGVFERIDQPLHAKAWLFEQRPAEGGTPKRALLVQADLIWWGSERLPGLLRQLQERWDLSEEAVIFHASHTHGGPQMTNRLVPMLGTPDESTIRHIEQVVLEAVAESFRRLEPVRIERGRGQCRIGVHRRRTVNGSAVMLPNPDGPYDPEVTVIRFRSCATGTAAGVWFHYACHPTTTGENAVTSEFPGVAAETIAEAVGRHVPVSFLQGCCGDLRPALVKEGAFYRGSRDDVRRLGEQLGQEVIRVLEGRMEVLPPAALESRKAQVMLPFASVPEIAELQAEADAEGVRGEWSRLLLAQPERLQPAVPLELTHLQLAEGLSVLAMNAEVVVEYGKYIKALSGGSVLPLAYSNGMIGYVPTAEQIAEGGYEAKDSAYFFGLPAPFDSSIEERIRKKIQDILT